MTNTRRLRLWLIWIVTLGVIVVGAVLLHAEELRLRLDESQRQLLAETEYLQQLLDDMLAEGDYEKARDHIKLWGRLNAGTTRLRLSAANGFVLAEFQRVHAGEPTHSHKAEIAFAYQGDGQLLHEKTLGQIYAAQHRLAVLLALSVFGIAILGTALVLRVLRFEQLSESSALAQSQHLAAQGTLERMATLDALTGLPNRYTLDEQLSLRVAEADRFERKLAVLFIDLDNFKPINDTFGHATGDALLKSVAKRTSACLRGYDLLARFGGDEFVVLLSNVRGIGEVEQVAQKIGQALRPSIPIDAHDLNISSSIGISLFPDDADNPGDLLRRADAAMYSAKKAGRNCYRFFTSAMNETVSQRQSMERRLAHALRNAQLCVVYQPVIDLTTGAIDSCEALLRWPCAGEEIPPNEFLEIAQQSALMKELQAFVIQTVIHQIADWRAQGLARPRVDINFAGCRQALAELLDETQAQLRILKLQATDIGIEMTEQTLAEANMEVVARLNGLHQDGCRLLLDDYGSGVSSLTSIRELPIDVVKIDQSFVTQAPDSPVDAAIVRAMIDMAHSMGKKVIAEGVETSAQLAFVTAHGCDLAQGNHLFPAMDIDDLQALLLGRPPVAVLDRDNPD